MYAEDSFFSLTIAGRAGLIVLTLLLFAGSIAVVRVMTRVWATPIRVVAAIMLFWVFVWLSPQIYYLYYMVVFNGLPLQNVIHPPPTPLDIFRLMTFSDYATLSDHGKGIMAWMMIVAALWRRTPPFEHDLSIR